MISKTSTFKKKKDNKVKKILITICKMILKQQHIKFSIFKNIHYSKKHNKILEIDLFNHRHLFISSRKLIIVRKVI